ncbi:hypothetical protein DL93DRAFT_385862 [Clavulina sp. PMI_390]|nr:hypothetical protein DL93DRAFT_385862 [Clavulina sp. PMI_390]
MLTLSSVILASDMRNNNPHSSNTSAFPPPRVQQGSPPSTTSPLAYFLPPSSPIKKPSAFPWTSPTNATSPGASPTGGLSRILSNTNDSAISEDDDDPISPLARSMTHSGVLGSPTAAKGGGGSAGGGHFRSGSLSWHTHPAARERAAGVMRRLSLSGALGSGMKPSVSPPLSTTSPANGRVPSPPLPTPVSASVTNTPFRPPTPDRAATPKASALAERRGRSRGMSESVLKKRKVSPMGERMLKGHFDGFGL